MAFSDLEYNEEVSFLDASTSGLALNSGQSHSTSTECMTKNDALAKYNLNPSTMSIYASNELVPRTSWVNNLTYYTFQLQDNGSSDATCTEHSGTIYTLYSSSSVLEYGVNLYTDPELSEPFFTAEDTDIAFYDINVGQLVIYNFNTVVAVYACDTSDYYTYSFDPTGYTTTTDGCANRNLTSMFYSSSSNPNYLYIGLQLFLDTSLTTPVSGDNNWFASDGATLFQIDNGGIILDMYDCGA